MASQGEHGIQITLCSPVYASRVLLNGQPVYFSSLTIKADAKEEWPLVTMDYQVPGDVFDENGNVKPFLTVSGTLVVDKGG